VSREAATLPIRSIGAEEFEEYVRASELPYGHEVHPEDIEVGRTLVDYRRTLAAFDRERIVGTAELISFDVSLPGMTGDTMPMAGVTTVAVLPSHRRRGLLTALMRRQFEDLRDGGEPVAGLWASEAPIYGRFGYGIASGALNIQVDRPDARLAGEAGRAGDVRLVEPDEALACFPHIYERHRRGQGARGAQAPRTGQGARGAQAPRTGQGARGAQAPRTGRPGMPGRSPERWRAWLGYDPEHRREGWSRRYLAMVGDDGYVAYRIKVDWRDWVPNNTLDVEELCADDLDVELTLWRYCFDVDLVARVEANNRPIDELLPLLMTDPRRLRTVSHDALWIRPIRVGDALACRRYAVEDSLVLDVRDQLCPWNEGRWRLEAGPGGASCGRARDSADLALGPAELGAAFLGGERLARLARAGRVEEISPGAAARADTLFHAEPLPWCPFVF
jgi:predicted acetyltransferase